MDSNHHLIITCFNFIISKLGYLRYMEVRGQHVYNLLKYILEKDEVNKTMFIIVK